jgi:uncharacterized protein (TIGR04255 family)
LPGSGHGWCTQRSAATGGCIVTVVTGSRRAAAAPATTAPHYDRPPVVEALVEVYFAGSQWDMTIPGRFYERVKDRFPGVSSQVQLDIPIAPTGGPIGPLARERAQLRSADGSRIVQVGRDLLVVNRLRPYSEFTEWRPDFVAMLTLYRELAQPSPFARVGVRYLNKIVVPEPEVELSNYFRLYPEVPEGLGSPHGPFILRVETRPPSHPDHEFVATFGTSETDDGQPALLLDLYDTAKTSDGALDRIMDLVDEGHVNIAGAFEHSITDEARRLFGVRRVA